MSPTAAQCAGRGAVSLLPRSRLTRAAGQTAPPCSRSSNAGGDGAAVRLWPAVSAPARRAGPGASSGAGGNGSWACVRRSKQRQHPVAFGWRRSWCFSMPRAMPQVGQLAQAQPVAAGRACLRRKAGKPPVGTCSVRRGFRIGHLPDPGPDLPGWPRRARLAAAGRIVQAGTPDVGAADAGVAPPTTAMRSHRWRRRALECAMDLVRAAVEHRGVAPGAVAAPTGFGRSPRGDQQAAQERGLENQRMGCMAPGDTPQAGRHNAAMSDPTPRHARCCWSMAPATCTGVPRHAGFARRPNDRGSHPTGAIRGMINMLNALRKEYPDAPYAACVFDAPARPSATRCTRLQGPRADAR